jgi:hypothetical protein
MLRVCESEPVALFGLGDSSSNAVSRTELSTRIDDGVEDDGVEDDGIEDDGVDGRVNRNGFPDEAYPFVFSDVDVELVSTVDVDCVDRAEASARSLRHFNSEAAFALETQIATANKTTKLNRKRHSGSRLLTLRS